MYDLIVALESSRALADQRHPEIQNKKARQMHTYREATDEELFAVNVVKVSLSEMDAPGHPRSRVICAQCGEGVNDGREVSLPDGSTLCRSCAFGAYYQRRQKLVTNEWSEGPVPISVALNENQQLRD